VDDLRVCLTSHLPLLLQTDPTARMVIIDSGNPNSVVIVLLVSNISSLIVVAALFRVEFNHEDTGERSKVLWSLSSQLRKLACHYNIPVIVTNQVCQ